MARRQKTIRYESRWKVFGVPMLAVAGGPDESKGETRGVARGLIAVGDVAVGLIAVGGVATGGLAIGGISVGALGLGGVSLGGLILGGVALGYGAMGGVAVGQYARGGVALGTHVMSPKHRDAEAVKFFSHVFPGARRHLK